MTIDPKDKGAHYNIAVLGGVSFSFPHISGSITIDTPFGPVVANVFETSNGRSVMIQRHAEGQRHLPPHMINYRAMIWAVAKLGIGRVISVNSVGTMKGHPLGSFVLPDDFIDITKSRISTFYHEKTVHIDMTEPYCPQLRQGLKKVLAEKGLIFADGTYVCTEGPRFETRAEIRMMSNFGDIVGMTGVPEVVLAREMNLCYASICTVTNNACGLGAQKITASEVSEMVMENQTILTDVLITLIDGLDGSRSCNCMHATDEDARL